MYTPYFFSPSHAPRRCCRYACGALLPPHVHGTTCEKCSKLGYVPPVPQLPMPYTATSIPSRVRPDPSIFGALPLISRVRIIGLWDILLYFCINGIVSVSLRALQDHGSAPSIRKLPGHLLPPKGTVTDTITVTGFNDNNVIYPKVCVIGNHLLFVFLIFSCSCR